MQDLIKRRIAEGEHQQLEFKFEISDFRKIARTLVAFANSSGGSLLVGVKDNGAIAGVRSDEEFFMIDGAARLYCNPEIQFKVREWLTDKKKVLEIIIAEGTKKPYMAQDETGNWIAYIRQGDENFKAHRIMLKVWEGMKTGKIPTIRFRQAELKLLEYLEKNDQISISKFRRIAGLSVSQAESVLVDFALIKLIQIEYTLNAVYFRLTDNYSAILNQFNS